MTARVASPRSDHPTLDADQLARQRATLLTELDAQRRQVAELRQTADALMGQSDTDSLLERELAERGASRGLEVLADIEHALARLDDGTYGRCEGCGGPIAPARLEAIPHTRYCVSCPSRG